MELLYSLADLIGLIISYYAWGIPGLLICGFWSVLNRLSAMEEKTDNSELWKNVFKH